MVGTLDGIDASCAAPPDSVPTAWGSTPSTRGETEIRPLRMSDVALPAVGRKPGSPPFEIPTTA